MLRPSSQMTRLSRHQSRDVFLTHPLVRQQGRFITCEKATRRSRLNITEDSRVEGDGTKEDLSMTYRLVTSVLDPLDLLMCFSGTSTYSIARRHRSLLSSNDYTGKDATI